jgi:hypothetical protein
VQALIEETDPEGDPYRWFSYGVAHSPPLTWDPAVARQGSAVWLFYLDRQSLLARTHVLDGLEGAFDLDRMGLAPRGSTLAPAQAHPGRYRQIHPLLRGANVRWVLAFHPLPEDLVRRRGEVHLPGVREPLLLHELRQPLPRAFWVPDSGARDAVPPASPAGVDVRYRGLDPHTVEVAASTPPGFIVVLDGHHPDWTAEDRSGSIPLRQAFGRYRAFPTPGGEQVFTLRYRPSWPRLAFALAFLGLVGLGILVRR